MPKFIDFWNRDSGTYWFPFEKKQMNEFSKVKPNNQTSICGYVKWMDDTTFALLPTPYSNQTYLVCNNLTGKIPNHNSYISVEGNTKWTGLRQINSIVTGCYGELILNVKDWKEEKPVFEHTNLYEYFGLSRDFKLKDFQKDLLCSVEDIDPTIKDFLTFTMLGTSSFEEFMGGINLTLYDESEKGKPKSLLKQLTRILPKDIDKQHIIKTPFGAFSLRYETGFFTGNADKQLSSRINNLLENRLCGNSEFKQASLSLHSKNKAPQSFEDKPCALSDIPTVISGTTRVRKALIKPDYDSFKFMLIQHMHEPQIPESTELLVNISKRMEELVESYGLNSIQLSQHGFLNANRNARPTSIFRTSLAHIRAHRIDKITPQEMEKGLEYFEWNLDHVYNVWEDKFKKKTSKLPDKNEYGRIRRIIRKNDKGKGVSEKTIIEEANMKPQRTLDLLLEMHRIGWIYEIGHRCWRLLNP
jgi:hypothetical protein